MRCPTCGKKLTSYNDNCLYCDEDLKNYRSTSLERGAFILAIVGVIIALAPLFWEATILGMLIVLISFVFNIISIRVRKFYKFKIILILNLASIVSLVLWFFFLYFTYPIL